MVDLGVALADDVDRCRDARVAELRQDLVGQSLKHVGEVADLAFALLGIFIHREHAEDELLVLDVAGGNKLLEAFPVLGSELCGEFAELCDHVLLELLFKICGGVVFATLGQLGVEFERAVGRCIRGDVELLDHARCVGVGSFQIIVESFHLCGLEFARTDVGLVDEEADVGAVLLVDDALELVGSDGRIDCACVGEGGCCDNAVGYLDARKHILLLALLNVEFQIELALDHLGSVGEVGGNHNAAAEVVAYDGIVAAHFLTLIFDGGARCLVVAVDKHRSYGDGGVLHEELCRHVACDGGGHLCADYFKRVGVAVEVVSRKLVHLLAAAAHYDHGSCRNSQT